MDGLLPEQIEYLKKFLVELHEKVPHDSIESNEHFLDDAVNSVDAKYMFFVREGRKYQTFHGDIYVSSYGTTPKVSINIGYESMFISGKDYRNELDEIAEKTEVKICESLNNHVTGSEPSSLGFVNVPIFREDGTKLTVDEFVTDYLFKVSQAANLARELEVRLVPELLSE